MPNDEKKVEIPESEFKALLDSIKTLSARVAEVESNRSPVDGETGKTTLRAPKERKVTVLFLNGKPIVGITNVGTEDRPLRVYEVPDPKDNRKNILQAEVLLKDVKTGKVERATVNWLETVREAEKREVRVLKTQDEPWEIEQGVVRKKEVEGYSSIELDVMVPLLVEGSVRHFVVDIDGVATSIHEDYVNIAR